MRFNFLGKGGGGELTFKYFTRNKDRMIKLGADINILFYKWKKYSLFRAADEAIWLADESD